MKSLISFEKVIPSSRKHEQLNGTTGRGFYYTAACTTAATTTETYHVLTASQGQN